MDKYEYKIKTDEIKDLISLGEYAQAADIADTIDWRRVRSVKMLCTISDLYKINRRLEDARDLLLLAYGYRPGGRNICYALCELSIKLGEFGMAVKYFNEFVLVAPKDSGRYILRYKLYEAQDVSLEERIEVLEELKSHDYREKWVYELAYLYHRVGLGTRCVEECDELILMLGEGKYVIKAMELKMLHQPLTPEQQEKYDNRFGKPEDSLLAESVAYEPETDQTYVAESNAEYSVESDAVRDARTIEFKPVRGQDPVQTVPEMTEPEPAEAEKNEPDELDIQVQPVNVGEYNTVDLQKELALEMQEMFANEQNKSMSADEIIQALVAPMMENDEETPDEPETAAEEDVPPQPAAEEIESSEVFFGETGNIGNLPEEVLTPVEKEEKPVIKVQDRTGEIVMQQIRQETSAENKKMLVVEPPKEIAHVLAQEADGQISFVVPDSKNVEKQITGQMNIGDILAEWERVKQENVEKRKEEVRQHVLQQTGRMFSEFDAAVRDGLLEHLEQEEITEEPEKSAEYGEAEELAEVAEETEEELAAEGEYESEEEPAAEEGYEADEESAEYGEVEELAEIAEEQETEEGLAAEGEYESEEEPAAEEGYEADEESAEYGEVEELAEVAEETEEELAAEGEYESEEEPAAEEGSAAEEESAEYGEAEELAEVAEEPETEEAFAAEEESAAEEGSAADEEPAEREVAASKEPEVVRDKAKVRSMTKEEQALYAPFIQSRAARDQIVKAIDGISLAAYTGNVIITGEEGMDTMSLAKNMVKELQAADSNFSGKIAKISGRALNKKNVSDVVQQLQNGALIIQKACDMDDAIVHKLYKALQQEDLGIVVLIEDNRKVMNSFLIEYEKLLNVFTVRVDVEALSNDTLVAFGKKYAQEQEYSIDELGVLALHTRIEEKQTIDHAVTTPEVKMMIDEAIQHANRKNIKHFVDVLLFKRYDENDMIILTERDFA